MAKSNQAKAFNPFLERNRRPLKERGVQYSPDNASPQTIAGRVQSTNRPDLELRIYRNYLGVLSLLGRLAENVSQKDIIERTNLEQAFNDANEVLRRKDTDTYYEFSSRGGFSMFSEARVKKAPV